MHAPHKHPGAEPQRIRVVICDDSPFMRRLIRDGLERGGSAETAPPGSAIIEVVGTAANARTAVELCNSLHPDVLTLDLQLPDLDGVRVLQHLRSMSVRVLVVSAFTSDSSTERAVEALTEGAVDVIGKPNLDSSPSIFFAQLLDRVRDIAGGAPYSPVSRVPIRDRRSDTASRLVVIGASTGGPRALHAVLSALPADYPAPIVVVQHMPHGFTAPFARRLDAACDLHVCEATDVDELEPGTVYIAAAGQHLHVVGRGVTVRPGPAVNHLCPSIDVTMIDAAATWGDRVTGIVLTGIGSDGREGARAIRAAGGRVVAEDASTCAVYGMSRAVIEDGLADVVCPLDEMALQLLEEVAS